MTTPFEKYFQRDRAILDFTSRYGLSLYPTLSRIFCADKSPGNAIRKLELAGFVQSHQRALPGRLSYVRLTQAGCAKLGVPKERSRPLGASAIDLNIAVQCFCCLAAVRRHKLERAETKQFFGADTPPANVVHVASEDFGYPAILRVFHAIADIARVQKAIREIADQIRGSKKLREWAEAGDYGLLVLCPTTQMQTAVSDAVQRLSLPPELRLLVELGPTAQTLAQALRDRGKSQP
jgi:hypothetical protein